MAVGVQDLIESALGAIKLNILVFGPTLKAVSTDESTRHLQDKRRQIRDELALLGHNVQYAEDLVDPSLGNMVFQEQIIMREYDLIITLVGSPGTIVEATMISQKSELAQKSQLFLDSRFTDGLTAEACRLAHDIGAFYLEYEYPKDLVECHLLGYAKERVHKAQLVRYFI
ncbi:hypothetical protein [Rhizobium leguminosarum]|uniref:hypothetical protein n=1 Tax=Rhizobium leguminosarum TaxID=384 RepID=UPI001C900424|nr:hypothetical protein [Rhizobium leguminosarum]MBY2937192.1 hypothetical protein [Rhizobium leguminosarum]